MSTNFRSVFLGFVRLDDRRQRLPPTIYVRRDGAVLCNLGGSQQNNDVHMVVAVAAGSMAGHGETG